MGFDLYDHRDHCFKEPGKAPQSCQSLEGGRTNCISTAEAPGGAGAGKENWGTDGGFSQQELDSDHPSALLGEEIPVCSGEAPDGLTQAAVGRKGTHSKSLKRNQGLKQTMSLSS